MSGDGLPAGLPAGLPPGLPTVSGPGSGGSGSGNHGSSSGYESLGSAPPSCSGRDSGKEDAPGQYATPSYHASPRPAPPRLPACFSEGLAGREVARRCWCLCSGRIVTLVLSLKACTVGRTWLAWTGAGPHAGSPPRPAPRAVLAREAATSEGRGASTRTSRRTCSTGLSNVSAARVPTWREDPPTTCMLCSHLPLLHV